MKYKIRLGEHCFGSFLTINNKEIIIDGDIKTNQELVSFIVDCLFLAKDNLSQDNYHEIMSILYARTTKFSLTEEEFETLEDEDNDASALMCYKINYDLSLMLDEVKNSANNFDNSDWTQLIQISLGHNIAALVKADSDKCDQCSNINWYEEYEIDI